jgi:type IV secretory pathway VirB2 component (pilin)
MSNIIKAWKTSLIGISLIGGAIGSVFAGKADWSGASIAIVTGIGLVFSPDTVIDNLTSKTNNSTPK